MSKGMKINIGNIRYLRYYLKLLFTWYPIILYILREIHKMTMQKKLEQVNMTQADSELYHSYLVNVQREIRELRVILESIEAKNKERIWLKNQSSGDVDDTKL